MTRGGRSVLEDYEFWKKSSDLKDENSTFNDLLILGMSSFCSGMTPANYLSLRDASFRSGMHYYMQNPMNHMTILSWLLHERTKYSNVDNMLCILDDNSKFDPFHYRRSEEVTLHVEEVTVNKKMSSETRTNTDSEYTRKSSFGPDESNGSSTPVGYKGSLSLAGSSCTSSCNTPKGYGLRLSSKMFFSRVMSSLSTKSGRHKVSPEVLF